MKILDTDILSLFFAGHPKVVERRQREPDDVAMTIISYAEVLRGRFASLLTAEDGERLQRAQRWLDQTFADLVRIPQIIPIDTGAADNFDQLRAEKKLKKIGRGDLLIAAITLAHRAMLVTRNLKDFRQVPGLQVENWAD